MVLFSTQHAMRSLPVSRDDWWDGYINPGASDEQKACAPVRWATVWFALLMIVVASSTAYIVIVHPNVRIIPIVLGIFGYTYGSLLGVFFAGMLTRTRGNDRGNILAMVVGFLVVAVLSGLPNALHESLPVPPRTNTRSTLSPTGFPKWNSPGGSSSAPSPLSLLPFSSEAGPIRCRGAHASDNARPLGLVFDRFDSQVSQLARLDISRRLTIRSIPRLFFGNAITSRMLSSPHTSITSRSRPSAIPPWGGAPSRNAFRRCPNSVCCASGLIPRTSNIRACSSGS